MKAIGNLHKDMLDGKGETFQELLAASGGEIDILGLPEGENSRTIKLRVAETSVLNAILIPVLVIALARILFIGGLGFPY